MAAVRSVSWGGVGTDLHPSWPYLRMIASVRRLKDSEKAPSTVPLYAPAYGTVYWT
jgi:hypothetical protein